MLHLLITRASVHCQSHHIWRRLISVNGNRPQHIVVEITRDKMGIQQVGSEHIFSKLSTFTKILTGATTMKFSITLQQQNIRWRSENFWCKCQGITSTWILSNKKLLHSSAYFDSAFNNFAVLRRTPDMQPIKFIGCKH